jgi:hypothetical protein
VQGGKSLEVKEHDDPSIITCGVAGTSADRSARQVLVSLAYLKRRYISYDDPHIDDNGAYRDIWEVNSIPFVAKKGPHVVGSIRLIHRTRELRLPIELPDTDGFTMEIDPQYRELVNNASFEVSQLAKSPDPEHAADRNITVAVVRGFIACLQQRGEEKYAVAGIDERVRRLLNGPTLRLGLPAIGPTSYYVGSNSTPVLVNVADMIESSKRSNRKGLSDFLKQGQGVSGFEWYYGI